jgi:cystathionine beta-lyase
LEALSERAPMVLPLPAYDPQHGLAQITGREQWDLPVEPDDDRYALDLDALDRLFANGARTLLLTQPHNPAGHVHTRGELEGIRDVVVKHGARVVSDEIHGPLVLPGAEHISYLSLDGTADHAVAVVAASKAFNIPGLKCAQIVTGDDATRDRLVEIPMAHNDSWGSLGIVASVAAYDEGDAWLAALVERLDQQRTLLGQLLAAHLPEARMRPLEATYMAWLDLRAYGHADPAAVVLEGGVRVSPGDIYWPGLSGHVRLNIATSPDRLTEIVRRMAAALTGGDGGGGASAAGSA